MKCPKRGSAQQRPPRKHRGVVVETMVVGMLLGGCYWECGSGNISSPPTVTATQYIAGSLYMYYTYTYCTYTYRTYLLHRYCGACSSNCHIQYSKKPTQFSIYFQFWRYIRRILHKLHELLWFLRINLGILSFLVS